MNATFDRALAAVLRHEGGFVNHPQDPGGATNRGITLATYRKWVKKDGTVNDLKRITTEQVAKIYRSVYWNAIKGDQLPSGIDYAVFDYAVNSGPSRAAKALQGVLGVAADGIIGPVTLAAARAADPIKTVKALCDQRMAFLKSLKTWPTFGKGWERRVTDVLDDAIQLTAVRPIETDPATPPPPPAAPFPPPPDIPLPPPPPPAQELPKSTGALTIIAMIAVAAVLLGIVWLFGAK